MPIVWPDGLPLGAPMEDRFVETSVVVQIIGYVASALVVASLAMTSILRLRLIGLIGALTFLGYSLAIEAYPIAITNVVIASIHAWFLTKLLRHHEVFTVLHVAPTSKYLEYFCSFHADEIRTFLPGWSYRPDPDQISAFVLRDLVPAGLFIAVPGDGDRLHVSLDFAIPQYRDFRLGRFVYSKKSGILDEVTARFAVARGGSAAHTRYLERMGYCKVAGDGAEARYELDLSTIR